MNRLLDKLKRRIMLAATEACAYRENIRVASEAELKGILEEEFANFVTDTNVGNNDWIPVTERLPENNDNVRITVETHKGLEVAVGWYNHCKEKWKVCPSDDEEFYYCYSSGIVAWKENTDVPYNPESTEKPIQRTNADRIRTMTDEELADVIIKNSCNTFSEVIKFCKNSEECSDMLDSFNEIPESMCRKCLLEWLQQPEGGVPG